MASVFRIVSFSTSSAFQPFKLTTGDPSGGSDGPTGPAGATGSAGPVGPPGVPGATGPTGSGVSVFAQVAHINDLREPIDVYDTVGYLVFEGTDNLPTPPTKITVSARRTTCGGNAMVRYRVQDVTNMSTIATSAFTSLSLVNPTLVDLGSVSSLPTSEAAWELQLLRETGLTGASIQTYSVSLLYES